MLISRRRFLIASSAATGSTLVWPAFAAQRVVTPAQTEGPFYPDRFPVDTDADLMTIRPSGPRAKGIATHLAGRVLATDGRPVAGALVEIWQCDANGRYLHTGDSSLWRSRDPNFQGYGRSVTGSNGEYRFRTIRPVRYPGRTPHIHFKISARDFEPLVTQMYVEGEAGNEGDGILNRIRDPAARASVIVPLVGAPELEAASLRGTFDIVMGG